MPSAPLGRFERQLRLTLVLLVLFLAAADLVNLVLLSRSRDVLEVAEMERVKSRAREVARAIGTLPAERAAVGGTAREFDLTRIAVLDAAQEPEAIWPERTRFWPEPDADARAALDAGRAVAFRDGSGIVTLVPVLDASGLRLRTVAAEQEAPALAALEGRLETLRIVQIAGLVAIAGLVLAFARWVARPYRTLAAAAGDAGIPPSILDSDADPDALATAFRGVAAKLREQEAALGEASREGGGLADLVRFAVGPGRGMTTGVAVVDRKGKLAALNPAAAVLLGADPEAARGQSLAVVASDVDGLRDLVAACLEKGRTATREVLEVRQREGRGTHLGVAVSPAGAPDGDVLGALILMTDLTEIRRLQEQARTRDNLAAVGQLAAGIAHEIRNALGTILGWARMLEKRDDPRVRGPAGEIVKEVDAVRASLDEFLLYARPQEPARVPLDLDDLVRRAVASAPDGLDVAAEGEFGVVSGDESLLRRVFGNLLQNAAEAGTEAGRPVSVRIVGRRSGSGRHVQIDVDDDGPGIPPERRREVFVPFFTTRAKGTGLGLALVQRTVVDLGGTVEVADGPRGGACFRIRLPLAEAETRV